jgi:putative ABC transport system permease protein
MMKTHIKIALRNLRKYPIFSLINLGGLSVGIAASFILLVYSQREMTCDNQFPDNGRIVRIGTDFFNMGGFAKSQPELRDILQRSCKDVQYATYFDKENEEVPVRLSANDRAYTGIYPYYVDTSFFRVFEYNTAAGAIPVKGLAPGEVILSEANARRFFSQEDPIGKTLLIGRDNTPYKVVAVLKENFSRSHLDPQLVLPMYPFQYSGQWANAGVFNYVKLKSAGGLPGLNATLDRILKKVVTPANSYMNLRFIVQPLRDIYFHSDLKLELSPGGNLTQVRLLGAIGLFLILLAVINYVNLVTARSSTRHKEIGVKKTFGASRRHLAGQIMMESLLFSLMAMVISLGLIRVISGLYHYATGVSLTGELPLMISHYGWLLLFSIGVGLVAGLYPAFYLTALRPILSLRSWTGRTGKSNPGVRNMLVLVQFSIAAALVFASFVVYSQLRYISHKDKGLRAEGVLLVDHLNGLGSQEAFRQLIGQQSQVVSTSYCNRTPAGKTIWMNTYQTAAMKDVMTIQSFPVDDAFLTTMGIRLTGGRNFNKDLITDTNSLILNESAVAALGLFNPIGTTLNGSEHIIGVVKDFNYNSLHEKIAPAILRYSSKGNILAIRVKGGHTAEFLQWLQAAGKKYMPGEQPVISFLDENFRQLAAKDKLLGDAIVFFTILAIILATLGLTGLTLFTIERRTKEIGVRKVLGATIPDILALVSKDFIRLTFLASGIALPLSWWLVHRWLENFAYRVSISVWIFFVTESILLVIALAVIGLLALKAAAVSPVKSLRAE